MQYEHPSRKQNLFGCPFPRQTRKRRSTRILVAAFETAPSQEVGLGEWSQSHREEEKSKSGLYVTRVLPIKEIMRKLTPVPTDNRSERELSSEVKEIEL